VWASIVAVLFIDLLRSLFERGGRGVVAGNLGKRPAQQAAVHACSLDSTAQRVLAAKPPSTHQQPRRGLSQTSAECHCF
jgi:hypothetical protein